MQTFRDIITIDLEKKLFIKEFDEDRFDLMNEKFKVLNLIDFKDTGVRIPPVKRIIESERKIVFDFIPDLQPLRKYMLRGDKAIDLAGRIGRGLHIAHHNLKLKEKYKILLPPPFQKYDEKVFLHLDFNTVNVQYQEKNDLIYFVDWEISPLLEGPWSYGCRYYDLIYFIYQVFVSPPYLWIQKKKKQKIIDNFLNGYFTGDTSINKDLLKQIADDYYKVFNPFEKYSPWKYLIKKRNHIAFLEYTNNLTKL